jgi:hypothetical protein|tara:strand:- start:316 stop:483 length:168 start_codon:yes stop_codon:yes gene_type:complete
MPTQDQAQKAAGVDKSPAPKVLGRRIMKSRNRTIESDLTIDNCPYKGNPALNANR